MSILFPKVPKPREWDYRPIYYDEEKERRKERLKQIQEERGMTTDNKDGKNEYKPTLHRGSFREIADRNKSARIKQSRSTTIRIWVIVLLLLLLFWYFLA